MAEFRTGPGLVNSQAVVACLQRYPYGSVRSGTEYALPGEQSFTGQRVDLSSGLHFYNARYYDSFTGRFVSPDTVVPEPGNPQDLNRYTYARNNPLRFVDPSGHAACAAGDMWCWQDRWYRAHGYRWGGSHWNIKSDPQFDDEEILLETVGEAGISFAGAWDFATQMIPVATGIVKFGQKLRQGLARLKELLGGGAVMHHGAKTPRYCVGASACALPPGTKNVYFSDELLRQGADWIAMTTVHELAHVIDWHSRIRIGGRYGRFSDAWHGAPLTRYAGCSPFTSGNQCGSNRWERWAEAMTVWVFGDAYKKAERPLNVDIGAQRQRIEALLNGWW